MESSSVFGFLKVDANGVNFRSLKKIMFSPAAEQLHILKDLNLETPLSNK
jgi:hypothetical protein